MLWTSEDIVNATHGTLVGGRFDSNGLSIDTRSLQKDDLFVAIEGDHVDGHEYIDQALEKGASGILVHKDVDVHPLIKADNTLKAMERLGVAARARMKGKVIGVTGSVGKTTVKEMLATVFGAIGKAHASKGSYNNHWGVPYTLAAMPEDTNFGVFEMGMNHAGEITPLSQMVRPDIAIITTISEVHIEHFNNVHEIADAKAEIFDGMEKGNPVILNVDDGFFEYLSTKAKEKNLIPYGFGSNMIKTSYLENGKQIIEANILDAPVTYCLQLHGQHMVVNSLAVLLAVKLAGQDIQKSADALASLEPLEGRGKRYHRNDMLIIDESYNASPIAMRAALEVLASVEAKRKIAVLGDMYELGAESAQMHAALADDIERLDIDGVITCGQNVKNLYDALPEEKRFLHNESHNNIAEQIGDYLSAGDAVLVKGSRGGLEKPRMRYIVDAI